MIVTREAEGTRRQRWLTGTWWTKGVRASLKITQGECKDILYYAEEATPDCSVIHRPGQNMHVKG